MSEPNQESEMSDVKSQIAENQMPQANNDGGVQHAIVTVLKQPTFLIVTVVLLAAAVGLNAAVNVLKLHFKKEPVALARPLAAIPDRFGTWVQVSQDQPLDKEMQDVLGTDKYIFRDYVDERVVGPGVQQTYRRLQEAVAAATDEKEREKRDRDLRMFVPNIRAKTPNAVIYLSVTYYTGMVDTVAHVPDRCVTADGYEPKSYDVKKWPIAHDLPAHLKKDGDDIEVRYINFEDQTGTSNVPRSISYFFSVNGEFNSSPIGVRQKLASLTERKAYYAKIECMTAMENADESAKVQTDFLAAAMPDIQRCMPDWDKVQGGGAEQVAAK